MTFKNANYSHADNWLVYVSFEAWLRESDLNLQFGRFRLDIKKSRSDRRTFIS